MLPKTNPDAPPSDFLRPGGSGAQALERLRALQGPLDEASGLEALTVILETIQLHFGALFYFDSEESTLKLLSHCGLSEPSLDALRTIRRGVSGVWDMPLHAVLQRRVYIVEKPRENPFVPQLLEGKEQGVLTNLAVIPIFGGSAVTGALLLLGTGVHSVRDVDVVNLREHTRVLGALLRRPDTRGGVRAPRVLQPVAEIRPDAARERAALTARVSELQAQIETLRRSPAPAVAEAERRLAEVTRERERLASELSLQEVALRSTRSEHELLRQQNASETERGHRMALELTRAREELTAAREASLRLQQDRDRAEQAHGEAQAQLAAAQRQLAEVIERSRAGESRGTDAIARLAALEAEREELRRALGARERQVEEVRAEREQLMESLQGALGRYQETENELNSLREGGEEERSSLQAQIEAMQAELANVQSERDHLRAGTAGRGEVLQQIERETERFRSELAREAERRRAAEQTAASVIHDAATVRSELERLQATGAAAEEELVGLRRAREDLATEVQHLGLRLRESEERVGSEITRLRATLATAEGERSALLGDLEHRQIELDRLLERSTELEKRANQGASTERALREENAGLAKQLAELRDSLGALAREREALVARSGSLQENVAQLLREIEGSRAERAKRDEELTLARQAAAERQAEMDAALAQVRTVESRLREEAEARARDQSVARQATEEITALGNELDALRADLERAQAFGSQLTADLDTRSRSESELRQRVVALQQEVDSRDERLEAEGEQRAQLEQRLSQMEEALRGTSGQLAEKAREVDFITVLRATLGKSEAARRQAEESIARIEQALAAEQRAAQTARDEMEASQQETRDLAARIEELGRRLREAEESAAEANQRAAEASGEQAAAAESASQMAAELGRSAATIADATARIEALERELAEGHSAGENAQRLTQGIEETVRAQAQELAELKRRAAALEEEKQGRIHALELELAEARSRTEHAAAEFASAHEEQRRLVETVRALEADRHKAAEALLEANGKGAEAEASAAERKAEAARLAGEVESLRRRAESLETNLRSIEGESARWRGLAEKLQVTLDERTKETQAASTVSESAAGRPAGAAPAAKGPATVKPLRLVSPTPPAASAASGLAVGGGPIVLLDDPGTSLKALTEACTRAGVEVVAPEKQEAVDASPGLVAVNLLAPERGGFEAVQRYLNDEKLRSAPLTIYAARPGAKGGISFPNVRCLVRPLEEGMFMSTLGALLGRGKRVTIVGEELDSVLQLNAWATNRGCSVSSAGDLKQGGEILDIVKPDLVIFDFSRLGGECASLLVKTRRAPRLEGLPVLLVIPDGPKAQTANFFLKRLATLGDETPFDVGPFEKRLRDGA